MFRFYSIMHELHFPDEGMGNVILEDEIEDKTTEEEDKEGEESEEEDKEEEDKEEKEEEEPELTRVEFKEVTGKFPSLFKEFPTLKHAFFREQQFSERFPTVEDADNALKAQEAYEEIKALVVDGDAKKFIEELKTESNDSLEKFAGNFLTSLRETDKNLYFDTVTPVVEQFLRDVYNHGLSEKSDNIKNAAKIVRKILFGGAYEDIEKDTPLTKKDRSKDEERLEKDKAEYLQGKYNTLYSEVSNTCYSKLDEEIERGLVDLKSKPGIKKIIAKEIKSQVLEQMNNDAAHLGRMQALWKREQRNGFSGTIKNSFVTTFLGKAKTIIPKVRAEVRKEALGKEDKEEGKESSRLTGGRASSGSGKKMTPERAKTEGLSTRQVFDE